MGTAPLCLPVDGALGSGWLWRLAVVLRGPSGPGWSTLEHLWHGVAAAWHQPLSCDSVRFHPFWFEKNAFRGDLSWAL